MMSPLREVVSSHSFTSSFPSFALCKFVDKRKCTLNLDRTKENQL